MSIHDAKVEESKVTISMCKPQASSVPVLSYIPNFSKGYSPIYLYLVHVKYGSYCYLTKR